MRAPALGKNDFSKILNILTHHLTEVQAKMQMQMYTHL